MTPFGYRVLGFGSGGVAPEYIAATGPDDAAGVTDGNYKYHIFNATKTGANGFSVSAVGNEQGSNTVEYLVIAGGGGGSGMYYGGGGGAGGYRNSCTEDTYSGDSSSLESALSVSVQDYNVTIGAGGAEVGGYNTDGNYGNDSVFSSITSDAGGRGTTTTDGGDGGSGGGGGKAVRDGGTGTAGQGGDGGKGGGDKSGGGGGASGDGGNSTGWDGVTDPDWQSGTVGAGADGLASSITGSSVTRAGGGGAGGNYVYIASGDGGAGGGGDGGDPNRGNTAGTVNTGSGGGGGNHSNIGIANMGRAGGSGVVIIRYKFQ